MEAMTSLRQLWNLSKTENLPLLGTEEIISNFPFMNDYRNNFSLLDRQFIVEKGYFTPLWNLQYEDNNFSVLTEFRNNVNSLLFTKQNEYQRLYDLTKIEYNPIENYKMTETGTDARTLAGEKNNVYDTVKSTNEIGASTQNNQYGNVSETDTVGSAVDTSNIGEQTSTSNSGIAGFNSSSYNNSDSKNDTNGARVDSTEYGARNSNHTEASKTDTITTASKTDVSTVDTRTDVITDNTTDNNTHNLVRSGNIGVTTTQQMAESELKLWTSFNFYGMLFSDIITNLCTYKDEGYEAFKGGYLWGL